MTISLIKSDSKPPTWIVSEGGDFLGEVIHSGFRQWTAEAMDGTRFRAPSRREGIMRLRIHRPATT